MGKTLIADLKSLDIILGVKKNSEQANNFYSIMEKNHILLEKIFFSIQKFVTKKKKLDHCLIHIGLNLNLTNYSSLIFITNKKSHSILVLTCAVIWALNQTAECKVLQENHLIDVSEHGSYDVIEEIRLFIELFRGWNSSDLEMSNTLFNKSIFTVLSILVGDGVLQQRTNFIIWLNKNSSTYSSHLFQKIKIKKIFTEKFEYKKIKNDALLIGNHYSFSYKLYIPNWNNNSSIKLYNDDTIIELTNLSTNVDFDHLKDLLNIFVRHHNIQIENLEEDYKKYIKEYKLSFKQGNKNLFQTISKKISLYQKAIELKNVLKNDYEKDEKFFLPWKHDSRGRSYFLSDLSFTFNKEIRLSMFQGYYNKNIDFEPIYHVYNIRIQKELNKYTHFIDFLNINIFNKNNMYVRQTILWLLISLGEINKTELGTQVLISQFIHEGIKIFNNFHEKNSFNYDDKIKIFTLVKIINEYKSNVEKDPIKKWLISKDAPASVFQHLVLNFGWNDDKILKQLNLLSENTWYDPYASIIEDWKKNNLNWSNEELEILKFFNRKLLKKILMTVNYGVSKKTAEIYFNNTLENLELDPLVNIFIKKNHLYFLNLFKNFFNFISEIVMFKIHPNKIINKIIDNKGIVELSDASIDLNYYKQLDITFDFQYAGQRYKKTYKAISSEKDFKKIEIAAKANFVHALDAALVRWVVRKKPIYTVHDCYLIDSANITYLVALMNEGMNERFNDFYKTWEKEKTEIFSLFIVL